MYRHLQSGGGLVRHLHRQEDAVHHLKRAHHHLLRGKLLWEDLRGGATVLVDHPLEVVEVAAFHLHHPLDLRIMNSCPLHQEGVDVLCRQSQKDKEVVPLLLLLGKDLLHLNQKTVLARALKDPQLKAKGEHSANRQPVLVLNVHLRPLGKEGIHLRPLGRDKILLLVIQNQHTKNQAELHLLKESSHPHTECHLLLDEKKERVKGSQAVRRRLVTGEFSLVIGSNPCC